MNKVLITKYGEVKTVGAMEYYPRGQCNSMTEHLHSFYYRNIRFMLMGQKRGYMDINKFELPPPIDKKTYYGNIEVYGYRDNTRVSINKEMFMEMYENEFGGFTDIVEEMGRLEIGEYDMNDNFIDNSDIEIEYDINMGY